MSSQSNVPANTQRETRDQLKVIDKLHQLFITRAMESFKQKLEKLENGEDVDGVTFKPSPPDTPQMSFIMRGSKGSEPKRTAQRDTNMQAKRAHDETEATQLYQQSFAPKPAQLPKRTAKQTTPIPPLTLENAHNHPSFRSILPAGSDAPGLPRGDKHSDSQSPPSLRIINSTAAEFFSMSHQNTSPAAMRSAGPKMDEQVDTADFTASNGDQDKWSVFNLPNIIYVLRPRPEHAKSRNRLRKTEVEVFGKRIRDLPVLPTRISSIVEGWRIEAWMRLDRRITAQDIIDRINPLFRNRITEDEIDRRREVFQNKFNVACWGNQRSVNEIVRKVKAVGIDPEWNTSRGLTPGLIDPTQGEAGGRVIIPKLENGEDMYSHQMQNNHVLIAHPFDHVPMDQALNMPHTPEDRKQWYPTGLSSAYNSNMETGVQPGVQAVFAAGVPAGQRSVVSPGMSYGFAPGLPLGYIPSWPMDMTAATIPQNQMMPGFQTLNGRKRKAPTDDMINSSEDEHPQVKRQKTPANGPSDTLNYPPPRELASHEGPYAYPMTLQEYLDMLDYYLRTNRLSFSQYMYARCGGDFEEMMRRDKGFLR